MFIFFVQIVDTSLAEAFLTIENITTIINYIVECEFRKQILSRSVGSILFQQQDIVGSYLFLLYNKNIIFYKYIINFTLFILIVVFIFYLIIYLYFTMSFYS